MIGRLHLPDKTPEHLGAGGIRAFCRIPDHTLTRSATQLFLLHPSCPATGTRTFFRCGRDFLRCTQMGKGLAMKCLVASCSLITVLMICYQASTAQIPRTLSYQGVLTDSLGNPKPDGTYSLTFRLYDTESGGTALWTEAKSLRVDRGLFSTLLGDQVAFGASMKFDEPYWLGLQVAGQPELTPRIPLSAVGYSLNSLTADTAAYARKSPVPSHVDSARIAGTVKDGAVTSAKIQDGTIQFADLAQNGATNGEVIKWNGSAWSAEPDASGSGGGGGWTDGGTAVGLTTPSDTVALNTSMRLGKLNINGDIGLNLTSSLYFGSSATRISGMIGGDLRLVAEDLTALTTENIYFGKYGDESWIGFNNSSKHVGIGTVDPADRLHVVNDAATSCWMRVESSHPSQWGQAGLRIKTPQNMWNLRMDLYTNANMPTGALSLYSQDGRTEAMTWLEDGRVGIGTLSPTKKLDVNGSARVKDTLFAGTLAANVVLHGPGVAYSRSMPYPIVHSYWTPIDTVVLSAPDDGYIFLSFSGTLASDHELTKITYVHIGLATKADGTDLLTRMDWRVNTNHPGGWYLSPASLQTVVRVSARGSRSFYVVGMKEGSGTDTDIIKMLGGSFSAIYYPASYGTVDDPPGFAE